MDKIQHRRTIIYDFLEEQKDLPNEDYPLLRNVLTIDEENQHFILCNMGWHENNFVYSILYHIELKNNGEVWFYENKTDFPIDDFLVEQGIPTSEIIAAWSFTGKERTKTDPQESLTT